MQFSTLFLVAVAPFLTSALPQYKPTPVWRYGPTGTITPVPTGSGYSRVPQPAPTAYYKPITPPQPQPADSVHMWPAPNPLKARQEAAPWFVNV